jgi:hypothetical protein
MRSTENKKPCKKQEYKNRLENKEFPRGYLRLPRPDKKLKHKDSK